MEVDHVIKWFDYVFTVSQCLDVYKYSQLECLQCLSLSVCSNNISV